MGAETGGANQGVNPQIQKMLTRIGPVVVFACGTKVSSASFHLFSEYVAVSNLKVPVHKVSGCSKSNATNIREEQIATRFTILYELNVIKPKY